MVKIGFGTIETLIPNLGVYTIPGTNATLPSFATDGSACFDICARFHEGKPITAYTTSNIEMRVSHTDGKFTVFKGWRVLVPTGLILDIPEGYSVRLHARSGLALKQGLVLANGEGVIDSDYTNELLVMMHTVGDNMVTICDGDRICQAELVRNQPTLFVSIPNPPQPKTTRNGGFGSTGVTT
jgi:dUTP pyrophosphatase